MPNNPATTLLQGVITALFLATWLVLGVASFVVFFLGKNAAFKRTWWPRFVILAGIFFVLFSTMITVLSSQTWESLGILVVLAPVVALISYLNIKLTKFCDRCGATLVSSSWLAPMRFCSKCGAALEGKPKPVEDHLG